MQETITLVAVPQAAAPAAWLETRVPAAPARVRALFVAERKGEPSVRHERARLVEQRGMAGCRWAARSKPGGLRQVLLFDTAVLHRFGLEPGVFKENLLVEGLPLDHLPPGQRLAIGPEVVLELTMGCPPCPAMDQIRPGLMRESWGYRGVLARVLVGGEVGVHDEVRLLEVNAAARRPKYPPLPGRKASG